MSKSIALKNLQITNLCFMFLFGIMLLCLFLDESFVVVMLFIVVSAVYLALLSVVLAEEFKDKHDRSTAAIILKVVAMAMAVLILFMFILYIVGIVCSVKMIEDIFEHVIPTFMIVHSVVLLAWILCRCRDYDKNGIILIRSKKGLTIVEPRANRFTYGNDTVSIDHITDIEVCYKTRQILKSNFDVSMKNNGLFFIGQTSHDNENKKFLESDDFSVVIRTRNVYHPVILILASYENCLKIAETCHLLKKRRLEKMNAQPQS